MDRSATLNLSHRGLIGTNGPPTNAQIEYGTIFTRSFFLVAFVVFFYDYLLTLPAEVQLIWRRRKRASAYWFLTNRYLALIANVFMVVFEIMPTTTVCTTYIGVMKAFLLMQSTVIFSILSLRVYAMFNLYRPVLFLLALAGTVVLGCAIWIMMTNNSPTLAGAAPPSSVGSGSGGALPTLTPACALEIYPQDVIRFAGVWEAQLGLNLLIFALTVYRGILYTGSDEYRLGLWRCLVRDGAPFFGIITMFSAANIVMYYLGDPMTSESLNWLSAMLTTVLLTRLILSLHASSARGILHTTPRHRPPPAQETKHKSQL
ncbi:hypothetical protein MSAN_01029000 [Mycena sanguinolenta]|uniref:DUF6533 domain-containing protein n=1 Tax=Mycena sanguinolenta TaxID=230812 RepID=A0A8H6YRU4_9AGAR|nr:hypothetical protein MSAN_01029000 [Mycena sanguinolenta]